MPQQLTSTEKDFQRLLILVGVERAQALITDMVGGRPLAGQKKLQHFQKVGEAVTTALGKRPGRVIDPNSAQQRVWAAVRTLLAKEPNGVEMSDQWGKLANKLGLSEAVVQRNALKCAGIKRVRGTWILI